jgi:SAM-dependent methyltransferase
MPAGDAGAGAHVRFRCNLCGAGNHVAQDAFDRETPTCTRCRSNVRFRSMGHLVVRSLLGHDVALHDLPVNKRLRGIGLSDADAYALPLAAKFEYLNTFFHKEPRLDIANPDFSRYGGYDFIVASDVFEHVAPPVSRAFRNAYRLLKPGGKLIFSVPFSLESETVEHFPKLHDWRVYESGGRWRLTNRALDGTLTHHENLIFHGGPGTTLEMRLFSQAGLLRDFEQAGFTRVRIATESVGQFGIHWPCVWSVPMVAHR